MMPILRPVLAVLLALIGSCQSPRRSRQTDAGPCGEAATPVHVGIVSHRSLDEMVTGPGRTEAIEQQKVRAPFSGVLLSLEVEDGDRVSTHQVIGQIVSANSQAALIGAQSMLKSARTSHEIRDARRAVALARRNLVRAPLRVPESGVVLKHFADEGALVAEQEDLVAIAALDSFVFIAEVLQTELPRVRAGQAATITLAARPPLRGVVHAILPSGSSGNLSTPVRVDLAPKEAPYELNLFGTVSIVVGVHTDATVVPAAAVLRDDITGISRVALVATGNRLHWIQVRTGLAEAGVVEIQHPGLNLGQPVILSGQVGLPEGACVREEEP